MGKHLHLSEFDHPSRAFGYQVAREQMRAVRGQELELLIRMLDPRPGECLLDFGTGDGFLSFVLAQAVGRSGRVPAVDVSHRLISRLCADSVATNIHPLLIEDGTLPLRDGVLDGIATLASIHHIRDKEAAFREFGRTLRQGGRLVLADVSDGTDVQRYFDGFIDRYCSVGHRHRFLNPAWARTLCDAAGLDVKHWSVEDVPWHFTSAVEARRFIHSLHDLQCLPQEGYRQADDYLGFVHTDDGLRLRWQLAYLVAWKP